MEEVLLEAEGITIRGELYLPEGPPPHPALCVCHGIPSGGPQQNGGGYPELAGRISGQGLAVFTFNFRGAGKSGGNFDLAGWVRDLEAVIGCLRCREEVDGERLGLLGFSAGAAVAVCVAARNPGIAFVASCACPAEFSFVDTVEHPEDAVAHFRSIGTIRDSDFPPSSEEWLDGFRQVRPVEHIGRIFPRPVLIVHGDRDETVPVGDALRLCGAAGEAGKLVIIEGAGHRLRQEERAIRAVIDWLQTVCPVDRPQQRRYNSNWWGK